MFDKRFGEPERFLSQDFYTEKGNELCNFCVKGEVIDAYV